MNKSSQLFREAMVLALPLLIAADAAAPPKAARSVHLSYISKPATAFYAELTVEKSVPGSYFEVCGFNGGYFGIQEKEHDKKVGIFSVWDTSKGDDPKAVAEKDRVQMQFVGDGVRASRFGGEGTGAHSDFDFDWKLGQRYRFVLQSKVVGKSTEYSAWIFEPAKQSWMHIATFAAPDGGRQLTGLYSFIEDFRRDTASATEVRRARFGNQWIKLSEGDKWMSLTKTHFTASGASWEAKDTINTGVEQADFFLQTGGDTKQQTPLHATIERPNPNPTLADLPKESQAHADANPK